MPALPQATTRAPRLLLGGVLALLLAGTGCRDTKVVAYRIAKEHDAAVPASQAGENPAHGSMPGSMPTTAPTSTPAATSPMANMAASPVATATGASLTWTAPASWQPKALGTMRKGSFIVTGPNGATGDLSITAFPGAVGGELGNINRWRGQIALAPIAESELPAATNHVTANNLNFILVDLAGTGDQAQRILGAMVSFDQSMWFFKLMGPDALVAAEKPAFLAFLQTIKASAPANP